MASPAAHSMQLLHAVILIFVLLAQALPVSAVAREDAPPVCGMKCCDPGATVCCCAGPTDAPSSPAPASTPPVTGRDLVPQPLWVAWSGGVNFLPVAAVADAATQRCGDQRALAAPHVRLPVLFCSLLN